MTVSPPLLRTFLVGLISLAVSAGSPAQLPGTMGGSEPATAVAKPGEAAPSKVDVQPLAGDEQIRGRLQNILEATGWFTAPRVRVEEGVVFLEGQAGSEARKIWAGDLAHSTQDVVAVVNRMKVTQPTIWDFQPAWAGLLELWRDLIHSLPFIAFAALILLVSAGVSILVTGRMRKVLRQRVRANILRNVIARSVGVVVFLFGAYVVLRVSGLTQLALTVIGGTGLIGLVLGIAFREISENFLASIFLSMQQPFETGDLVEIDGVTGYVQQLNLRTTVVMSTDGNLVQIPNATVYKSNLRNFTTNANRRDDFIVGIGYDDSISRAQEIARGVLATHPAVLRDPEPSVLVDNLGSATVNLRVYFWLNGREYSWLKVRSSVIRLVKRAFQENGISMPDEAREMIFPQGVPVLLHGEEKKNAVEPAGPVIPPVRPPEEVDAVSTSAEAGLYSEKGLLEEQAREAQPVREGENLLGGGS